MFWLNVDLPTQTAILHREDCVHAEPKETDLKGLNEMKVDGGWFSFNSVGEAMRYHKTQRLSGEVHACLFCRPLDQISDVPMARLDVNVPKTGCDACDTSIPVTDTKTSYRKLVGRLLGEK